MRDAGQRTSSSKTSSIFSSQSSKVKSVKILSAEDSLPTSIDMVKTEGEEVLVNISMKSLGQDKKAEEVLQNSEPSSPDKPY